MKLELLDIDTIAVQDGYNIRSDREVAANAKDIAALMEATGDNVEDPRFILRYVQDAAKNKFTRNHATLQAAIDRGWKKIAATKVSYELGSVEDELDIIFSNNFGHPVDRRAQGQIFMRLRDGVMEDQSEAIANAKVGEEIKPAYIREPLTLEEIGERCGSAFGAKRSQAHVSQCIAIAEAYDISPEVSELIESGKISDAVMPLVTSWATKGEGEEPKAGKMLKICRRAIQVAKEEGKETATKKHLDAIKLEFFPLKADTSKAAKKDTEKDNGADTKEKDAGEAPVKGKEPSTPPPQSTMDLGTPSAPKTKPLPAGKVKQTIIDVLEASDDDLDAADAERYADALIKAGMTFATSPL